MIAEDQALLRLLGLLDRQGYRFVTPTPATHARVLARRERPTAQTIEDALGWSLPFRPGTFGQEIEQALADGGMLDVRGALWRSRIRVSSLHHRLYVHSAYPTAAEDAVFFGPDTYRFADFILAGLASGPRAPASIADVATGSGAGAIVAATACPAARIIATDINPTALRFARINAAHAGLSIETVEGAGLDAVEERLDLVVANPPYIIDPAQRQYRHGGGMHGGELSLHLACQAMDRLTPGGRLILYTGSAIVRGRDALGEALGRAAGDRGCAMHYRELDPDIFGEELDQPAYAEVDRIALVGAVIQAEPSA